MVSPLFALVLAVAPPTSGPTPVEGVTVVAPRDPAVVSTYPADGAAIPYGTVVLKVTFDQPMTPDAWSYDRAPDGVLPGCLARPRLLADRRSFDLLCSLPPKTAFAITFRAAPDVISAAKRGAQAHILHFSTTDVHTAAVHDALVLAGLTDLDDPIMTWNGAAGPSRPATAAGVEGVSRTDAPRASAGGPR